MRSGIASPENVTEASGIASPTCSDCLTALARAKLLFFLIQCELLDLWALWSCGPCGVVVDALASSKRSGKSTGLLLASYAATYALRRTRHAGPPHPLPRR